MGSLDCLWKDRSVGNALKRRVMEAMVWSVALYGSEAWTLKAADRRRLTAFEMMTYRRMMQVDWREHRTNASILAELRPKQRLLERVQKRKLRYFGHLMRADNISTLLIQGRIEGTRARGRQRRRWMDDVCDWTRLYHLWTVSDGRRTEWNGGSAGQSGMEEAAVVVSGLRPSEMRMDSIIIILATIIIIQTTPPTPVF